MAVASSKAQHAAGGHFYHDYLTDAAGTLEDALVRLKNCENSRCSLDDAIDISHRIKGNAAMYGFADLGIVAGKTESRLRCQDHETDSAVALLALIDLIDKINDICQSHGKSERHALRNTPTIKSVDINSMSQSVDVSLDRRRILIAYEDIWVSEFIASLFGPEFSVKICQSGEDAFSQIRKFAPELIILENSFGGLDDLAFLKALKGNTHAQNIPIFMSFDPDTPDVIAQALSLGIDGFAIDKHEILDVVISAKSILEKRTHKVLVVDDDPVVRDLLSDVLTGGGLEVDTAVDGLEALTYLSQNTPDIILLDRFMPRLEGGTVLYEIQSKINLKSIPVLILTAMVNQGEATSWFERGATDFIPKPFDPEEVLMRVKQHLKPMQTVGHDPWL